MYYLYVPCWEKESVANYNFFWTENVYIPVIKYLICNHFHTNLLTVHVSCRPIHGENVAQVHNVGFQLDGNPEQ